MVKRIAVLGSYKMYRELMETLNSFSKHDFVHITGSDSIYGSEFFHVIYLFRWEDHYSMNPQEIEKLVKSRIR